MLMFSVKTGLSQLVVCILFYIKVIVFVNMKV